MVAAEINRNNRTFAKIRRFLVKGAGPGNIGFVVAQNRVGGCETADIRRAQIAMVRDGMAERPQRVLQACCPVSVRPHEAAALASTFVHRCAHQHNLFFNDVHTQLRLKIQLSKVC